MSKLNRFDRRDVRRQEAEERNEIYDGLTPAQRLEKLDLKLGKDQGAKKERQKLMALIQGKVSLPNKTMSLEDIATSTLPADVLNEIDAMNNDGESKKKLKAKERRKKEKKNN